MAQIWDEMKEGPPVLRVRRSNSQRTPLSELEQTSINLKRSNTDISKKKSKGKSAFDQHPVEACPSDDNHLVQKDNGIAKQRTLSSFKAPNPTEDSDCYIVSSGSSPPSPRSIKAAVADEQDTITLTAAHLRRLGFSDSEVEWAINEAKTRMSDEMGAADVHSLTEQVGSLSLEPCGCEETTDDTAAKEGPNTSASCLTGRVLNKVLEQLDTWTLIGLTQHVNQEWQQATTDALRNYILAPDPSKHYVGARALAPPLAVASEALQQHLPWGQYLAQGGFKRVFLCFNSAEQRQEAVSVMDLAAMADAGTLSVADTEIRVGHLLSSLVDRRVSPHFVRTFQFLRCSAEPPPCWGSEVNRQPQGPLQTFRDAAAAGKPRAVRRQAGRGGGRRGKRAMGDLQYIRMEFCAGGDIEEALRNSPAPPATVVWQLLYQMAAALHAGQEAFSMRHYDVKLLNFFLAEPDPNCTIVPLHNQAVEGFWGGPGRAGWVVKLADYGTVELRRASLGQPLEACHVTTWENTAPELLLFGAGATQGYGPDMHGLGLCLLHLLLGDAPYEEALEPLTCPRALARRLRKVWEEGAGYGAVAEVLRGGDDDETLLQDTLYRNLVLFATSHDLPGPGARGSAALEAVRKFASGTGKGQWRADVDAYSLFVASPSKSEAIARAQERMQNMAGCAELLGGMVDVIGEGRVCVRHVMDTCQKKMAAM